MTFHSEEATTKARISLHKSNRITIQLCVRSFFKGEVEEDLDQSTSRGTSQVVVDVGEIAVLELHEVAHVLEDLGGFGDGGSDLSGEGLSDEAGVEVGELGGHIEELAEGALPIKIRVK